MTKNWYIGMILATIGLLLTIFLAKPKMLDGVFPPEADDEPSWESGGPTYAVDSNYQKIKSHEE